MLWPRQIVGKYSVGNDERCSYCHVIRDSTRNLISRRRTLVEVAEFSLLGDQRLSSCSGDTLDKF